MKRIFYTNLLFLGLISNNLFAWQSGEANLYLGGVHIKQENGQFGGIQDALGNIYSTNTCGLYLLFSRAWVFFQYEILPKP